MMTNAKIDAMTNAGFSVRYHASRRWYLKYDGKDAGYVTDADADGTTGCCSHVTRRAGALAAALRGA